jgi:hypothetical protein
MNSSQTSRFAITYFFKMILDISGDVLKEFIVLVKKVPMNGKTSSGSFSRFIHQIASRALPPLPLDLRCSSNVNRQIMREQLSTKDLTPRGSYCRQIKTLLCLTRYYVLIQLTSFASRNSSICFSQAKFPKHSTHTSSFWYLLGTTVLRTLSGTPKSTLARDPHTLQMPEPGSLSLDLCTRCRAMTMTLTYFPICVGSAALI